MANNVGPLYAKNNLADVNSVDTARNSLSVQPIVADRTALKALDTSLNSAAYLKEAGRFGEFKFDSSNLSASVTIDTVEGDYIAPAAAPTGASGAWVRSRKVGEDYLTSEFGDNIVVAMNVCELRGGGRVLIDKRGTIQLPAGGVIKPSTVSLVGMGSGVTILGCDNYNADTDYISPAPTYMGGYMIMICKDGNNYQMTTLPSFTALGFGEASITFGSAHGLVVGDEICMYDDNAYSFSNDRIYYYLGERHYIIGVNGLTVYLSGSLLASYTYSVGVVTANKVHKWGGEFGGFTLDCSAAYTSAVDWTGIKVFRAANGAKIFDIEVLAARSTGIEFDQCFDITPRHIRASCRMDSTASANQYPILISNSSEVTVFDSFGRSLWSGFDIGGWDVPGAVQSYRSGYVRCVSATLGSTFAGNMHGNTQNCFYDECDLDGGVAVAGLNFRASKCKVRIQRGTQVTAFYSTEIVGGRMEILDCEIFSNKDAGATSFGCLQLALQTPAKQAVEFVIHNVRLDAVNETRPIYFYSLNTSYRASLSLGPAHFNCPSQDGNGLVRAFNSGSAPAADDYFSIQGVTGVAPGVLLYTLNGWIPTYQLVQGEMQSRVQTSGTSLNLGNVDIVRLNYAAPASISTFANVVLGKTYAVINLSGNAVTITRANAVLNGSADQVLNEYDMILLSGYSATAVAQIAPISVNG